MSTTQLGILLAIFFVIAIIFRIFRLKKDKNKEEIPSENTLDDPMQDLFFKKVSNGHEKIHFLDISGSSALQNIIILKNLFQSENIPYYSEFERFNAVYGGIVTSIKFYILKDDYANAIQLVNKYKETSPNSIKVIEHDI
ncbi:MAG: hypothetical protein BKP49_05535 [Treponema sp. CETP13]|nr:MAG: hypothetical protein BKP49_05535 [Treponema sp. CETP13]